MVSKYEQIYIDTFIIFIRYIYIYIIFHSLLNVKGHYQINFFILYFYNKFSFSYIGTGLMVFFSFFHKN